MLVETSLAQSAPIDLLRTTNRSKPKEGIAFEWTMVLAAELALLAGFLVSSRSHEGSSGADIPWRLLRLLGRVPILSVQQMHQYPTKNVVQRQVVLARVVSIFCRPSYEKQLELLRPGRQDVLILSSHNLQVNP